MSKRLISLSLLLSLLLFSCGKNLSDEEKISEVLKTQIEALNTENANKYISTIYDDGQSREVTLNSLNRTFETFDLNYSIKEMKIDFVSKDTAMVQVTLITTKIAGPEFRNNEATVVNTFLLQEGEWYCYTTELIDFKEIEKK